MQIEAFGDALIYLLCGLGFVSLGVLASKLLSPNRPYAEKQTSYECGEEPSGDAWVQFNPRYFSMALIFLVFDVEILLLFPFALVFTDETLIQTLPGWGVVALVELLVFLTVLALGLVYVWQRGDIDWQRPQAPAEDISTAVPNELYEQLNQRVSTQQPQLAAIGPDQPEAQSDA